jgi:hypothetical protein
MWPYGCRDSSACSADRVTRTALTPTPSCMRPTTDGYHERFLGLAERCRGLAAPTRYAGLLRDLAHLMDAPLAGYRTFINEFAQRVGEMPELAQR